MKILIRSYVIALAAALALLCATAGAASASPSAAASSRSTSSARTRTSASRCSTAAATWCDPARAGSLGGVVFRDVKPGAGYRVRPTGAARSRRCTVLSDRSAPPSTRIYSQKIPTSRLRLPDHARRDQARDRRAPARPATAGPYPTLVEYSGYGYADPAGGESGDRARSPTCSASRSSTSTCAAPGCSGGAFDYFEPLQGLDGYDVIETVARQPWVAAPQGRDDRRLLRRHQPAVRRRDRSRRASPRSRRCR